MTGRCDWSKMGKDPSRTVELPSLAVSLPSTNPASDNSTQLLNLNFTSKGNGLDMWWKSLLLQYSSIPVLQETPGSGGHESMHLIQCITNISQAITDCIVNRNIHRQVLKSINTHRQMISTNLALLYVHYLTSGVINCYDFWMPNGIIRYTSL